MSEAGPLGYLATLRRLEREAAGKPPIGRNRTLREAVVRVGQDPFLAFPETDISEIETEGDKARLRLRLLGLFGPQGPLPLSTTEDILRWFQQGDTAFVHFTDIFASRFQELFFRAWSDAHAISQFDHPEQDRFQDYVAAVAGTGTPAFQGRSPLPDTLKLPVVPLAGHRVKSPVRLRQMIGHLFDVAHIALDEHLLGWMEFEPDSYSLIGQQGATLGRDCIMGSRIPSVSETIGLRFHFDTLDQYRRFLPGGSDHDVLCDLIFWYLGKRFDIRVTLALLASEVAPAQLGVSADLGWMACIAPVEPKGDNDYVEATTFLLDPETLPVAA
ncbi:type VI secretion system baseplate subunit TssG [Aestuariibius insulae]|uniref:type VI secretion system baseplate subunit TssG n=1 Tax=Aestuariibius insulae TaxID=2058287 RepID=UPI00345F0E98